MTPINTYAYLAAQAGATAGMGVGGWITDSNVSDYSLVSSIASVFAEAFDLAWNNVAPIDILEQQTILAVVTQEFSGRAPGPLLTPSYQEVATWATSAAACVALVKEADITANNQGIIPPPIPNSDSQSPITVSVVYYVDPVDGNDKNPGTETMPVQTWAIGVGKLLGGFKPNVQGSGNLTITYQNPPLSTDPIFLNPTVGPNSYVLINTQIDKFVVETCTITAVTPKSRTSGGNQWQIKASVDLTSYAGIGGVMIHDITNDSWFWLDSIISGSGAAAILQVTQPLARASAPAIAEDYNALFVPELDTIAMGDSLVIYNFPLATFQYLYDEFNENINIGFFIQNFNCGYLNTVFTSGYVTFLECNTPFIQGANWIGSECNCYGWGVDHVVSNVGIVGGAFQGEIWSPNGGFICADVLTSASNSQGLIIKMAGDDFALDSICTLDGRSAITCHGSSVSVRVDNQFSSIYEGDGIIYGKGFVQAAYGASLSAFAHDPPGLLPAATAFQVPTILLDDRTYASAFNTTITPGVWLPHIALTGANIDAAVSAGGFGAIAYGVGGSKIFVFYEYPDIVPTQTIPNYVSLTNTSAITASSPLTFSAPAITRKGSGVFRVTGTSCPIPTGSPVEITFSLYRDSTQLPPLQKSSPVGPGDDSPCHQEWIDTVTDYNPHTYSLRATPQSGTLIDNAYHCTVTVNEL